MIFIALSAIDNIHSDIFILWGLLGAFSFIVFLTYYFEEVSKAWNDKEKRIYKKIVEMIWWTELCATIVYVFAKFRTD